MATEGLRKARTETIAHHMFIPGVARIPEGMLTDSNFRLEQKVLIGPNSATSIGMMAMIGEKGPRMRPQGTHGGDGYCAMTVTPVLATHACMASSGLGVLGMALGRLHRSITAPVVLKTSLVALT